MVIRKTLLHVTPEILLLKPFLWTIVQHFSWEALPSTAAGMGCAQDGIELLISTITDSQYGSGLFVVTQPQINQILKAESETPLERNWAFSLKGSWESTNHSTTFRITLTATVPVLRHTLPGVNLNILPARSGCILETSNVPLGIYKTFTAL